MDLSVSSYFKKLYAEPFKTFRFVVNVSGSVLGAFTQFSGIKTEVQTIQARSGNDLRGVQMYVPVLTSYAPVTLTKGVIFGNEFLDWLSDTSANMYTGPKGKNLQRTIEVAALDDDGKRGVVWTLHKAMPISYELAPMDSTQSTVLTESVTFAFVGLERSFTDISIRDS